MGANVNGTIEPLDNGTRSLVTLELNFEGHGSASSSSRWS